MTVVVPNKTSEPTKSKSKRTNEVNEFNQQTNKSQKKVSAQKMTGKQSADHVMKQSVCYHINEVF